MTKKPIQPQDKYVLRMPDGLRDRIKAYADRHGRSMNAEIVRVLEREYPEPWSAADRAAELVRLLGVLKKGADEKNLGKVVNALDETIVGIVNGRVSGLSDESRKVIGWAYDRIQHERLDDDSSHANLDPEEEEQLAISGRTDKIVGAKK